MKKKDLWFWAWTIVIVATTAVSLGQYLERSLPDYALDPEVVAAILGAAAALLAILFQRRSEFVASLRAEWASCLTAISLVRSLYVSSATTHADYLMAYRAVSVAIDGMRSVYRNVGESKSHVGLFPFQTLHDIRVQIMKDFGTGARPPHDQCEKSLDDIDCFWRLFRRAFLAELSTPETSVPIVAYRARDWRKPGMGWLSKVWHWRHRDAIASHIKDV